MSTPRVFCPRLPRGSVLTASCVSNSGSWSDTQALNEAPEGPQLPLSSGDEARCPVPAAPGQVHPHAVGGRPLAEPCTGSDEWLLEPLPPHPVGRRLVHCWDPQRLPFRALPSPSPVPRPLPSWKSLLPFSHLSVLSPPLGCAAINNSQVPPPLLPAALTEERAVVGVAPCWSVRDPQWGPSPRPVTRPQGRDWGSERPGPP